MDKQIIIIGAGVSGIAAATKLYENGFEKLIILEAENRIGGRVYTIPFGDNVLDLGAQWVEGKKGNPVYEWAKPLGLIRESEEIITPKVQYRRSTGEIIEFSKSSRLGKLVGAISENEEYKDYKGSYGEYMIEK